MQLFIKSCMGLSAQYSCEKLGKRYATEIRKHAQTPPRSGAITGAFGGRTEFQFPIVKCNYLFSLGT